MKRILLSLLLILGVVSFILFGGEIEQPLASQAVPSEYKTVVDRILPNQTIKRFWNLPKLDLTASSVMVIEADSGHVIYEENSDVSLPTASMSKMMTELLVLEAIEAGEINWDTEVPISEYAHFISHHPGYASVDLLSNRDYTVEELFHAMAIHSANGASIALAEAVSGSEQQFAHQMNERARELGLENSAFVNSTGLDNIHLGPFFSVGSIDDTNRMSAQDLITLAHYLIDNYPDILEITSKPYYFTNNKEYLNTNWLIRDGIAYEGVDGLKTGYTSQAGYCFTGTVEQDGIRLISVVMGTDTVAQRFAETEILYDVAFEHIAKWTQ